MYTGMACGCCKNGWRKDSVEVTGRQTRREKKRKTYIKVDG
jgi:hypothetical protein